MLNDNLDDQRRVLIFFKCVIGCYVHIEVNKFSLTLDRISKLFTNILKLLTFVKSFKIRSKVSQHLFNSVLLFF